MGSNIRPFKHHIGVDIKKRTPEPQTAKALRKDVDERIKASKKLPIKFQFELLYDALREEIEARLLEHGYKAYSHIAALASVKTIITEEELHYLNQVRELRNNSRYYAQTITQTDSDLAQIRIPKIIKKIRTNNSQAF